MNVAWNPPGLSSAIDRLMDFWDENVSMQMRRTHSALPPQSEPPAEGPPPDMSQHQERHVQHASAGQGCISALAVLAAG